MALINFKKVISELSDESFSVFKDYVSDIYPWYFIESKTSSKETCIEKTGEYMKYFELKNSKLRDNDLANIYADELLSLMNNRYSYGSVAEKYINKYRTIKDNMKKSDDVELIYCLEDLTKIFLCFYHAFINKYKEVDIITYFTDDIDYSKIVKHFISDKPEQGKDIKAFKNKVNSIMPSQVKDFGDKVQEGFEKIEMIIPKKHQDSLYEPIHDQIEKEKSIDLYNKRTMSLVLMTMFYLRISDFETGKVE